MNFTQVSEGTCLFFYQYASKILMTFPDILESEAKTVLLDIKHPAVKKQV